MVERVMGVRRKGLLAASLVVAAVAAHAPVPQAAARADLRPNVLIILTDDQRARGTYQMLPKTMELFRSEGTWFSNSFATTPLCCPSRASIYTGKYAHNHGVTDTDRVAELDESTTIQAYLHAAGYSTAVVGKYRTGGPIINFDRWSTMWPKHEYINSRFDLDGLIHRVHRYSTDFIASQAIDYLDELAPRRDPWYMVVSVYSPHSPALPAARDRGAAIEPWVQDPATLEEDVSDKPSAVRRVVARVAGQKKLTRRMRARQLRSLLSVDDAVHRIFSELDALQESNTLAFFLSDNGYLWHEHGLRKKSWPYDDSVRIPLFMRWPGHVLGGGIDDEIAANIDLAPTIYDAVGITPSVEMDGLSLFDPSERDEIMLEYWGPRPGRTWSSLRSADYQYVEYDNGEREYYDLRNDPWQLENLLAAGNDSGYLDVESLSQRLHDALSCSGSGCP
jgi:arylsulfatase A-like enzyme